MMRTVPYESMWREYEKLPIGGVADSGMGFMPPDQSIITWQRDAISDGKPFWVVKGEPISLHDHRLHDGRDVPPMSHVLFGITLVPDFRNAARADVTVKIGTYSYTLKLKKGMSTPFLKGTHPLPFFHALRYHDVSISSEDHVIISLSWGMLSLDSLQSLLRSRMIVFEECSSNSLQVYGSLIGGMLHENMTETLLAELMTGNPLGSEEVHRCPPLVEIQRP
jgi:hypothetical protein